MCVCVCMYVHVLSKREKKETYTGKYNKCTYLIFLIIIGAYPTVRAYYEKKK